MNTVIIVAAGSGNRFGSARPKQFLEIQGKPIIRYSMERFEQAPSIDEIVVVTATEYVSEFAADALAFGVSKLRRVVAGGRTRSESVQNGLASVGPDAKIVAVHDAVRPLVTADEIERTIAAAVEHGAACLVGTVDDTIKTVAGGFIGSTVDRTTLRRALTPQAFRLDVLRAAFEKSADGDSFTDECSLVEKLGLPIALVPGGPQNIKITYPADLLFAQAVLAGAA